MRARQERDEVCVCSDHEAISIPRPVPTAAHAVSGAHEAPGPDVPAIDPCHDGARTRGELDRVAIGMVDRLRVRAAREMECLAIARV